MTVDRDFLAALLDELVSPQRATIEDLVEAVSWN